MNHGRPTFTYTMNVGGLPALYFHLYDMNVGSHVHLYDMNVGGLPAAYESGRPAGLPATY